MTKEIDPRDIRIDRRDKPAGGRGAVKSTFDAFREQGIPFKAVSSLLLANKPKQFDCPGCAFPDKPGSPPFDSCEQGQKAIAWEMTRKAAAPDFFARHTIEQLRALSDHELELQGRLTTPMLYTAATGTYTAIGWQQAFDIAGAELRAIEPEQVAFYASGRSSNKAAFLWQLAARAYGCPNLPDSSNFCHEPSGFALKAATGVSKGTCSLEDFKHAELIMVIGQNPATNHPRMMTALRDAALRGTKVVAINPLRERGFTNCSDPKSVGEMLTGTGRAVAHRIYQVRIGGDLALFKGVMKRLLEMDSQARASGGARMLDERFIGDHTLGFDALARDMAAEPRDRLVAESGVNRDMINELAELYAGSRATMATWCMGLTHHASRITHHASRITHHASRITHHENSVATIQTLINLLLLKGNIGRPGAGAVPVRGHSNVQGDRTMGATSAVSARWLDNMAAEFPRARFTRTAGLDANGVIRELLAGERPCATTFRPGARRPTSRKHHRCCRCRWRLCTRRRPHTKKFR